jgi:hypothetical protein
MSNEGKDGSGSAVVHADPKLRRNVAVVLLALLLVGGIGLYWLDALRTSMEEWARNDPEGAIGRLKVTMQVLFVMMGVIPVTAGALLMHIARRVLKNRRYPPPDMRVVVDTAVIRGERARRVALVGVVLSTLLIVAGALVPVLGWHLLSILGP